MLVKGLDPLGAASQRIAHWDEALEYRFFQPTLNKMRHFSYRAAHLDNLVAPILFQPAIKGLIRFAQACARFDENTVSKIASRIATLTSQTRDGIYEAWLKMMNSLVRTWRVVGRTLFQSVIKVDYDHKNEKLFQSFSMMNLDINFIIIMFILLLSLGLGFIVLLY